MLNTARISAVALVLVLGGGLAACSEDKSAEQKAVDAVCDNRAALETSIEKVKDDLTAGNFGDANDELAKVKDNFEDLVSSVKDLTKERADEVQPEVDDLKDTIDRLANADNFGELGSALDDLGPKLEAVVKAIDTNLDCTNAD